MTIALLAGGNGHFAAQGTSGGVSGGGNIDTSGASLLFLVTNYQPGVPPTVSDSKGNTWIGLTAQEATGSGSTRIYHADNPTVGSSHTFSSLATGSFASLAVLALSGAATTSPFDQQAGTVSGLGGTSANCGGLTPGFDGEIVVVSLSAFNATTAPTINGGFTIADQLPLNGGVSYDIQFAYLIQTTAAAANPTWSWTTTSGFSMAMASAKAAAGGGIVPTSYFYREQIARMA